MGGKAAEELIFGVDKVWCSRTFWVQKWQQTQVERPMSCELGHHGGYRAAALEQRRGCDACCHFKRWPASRPQHSQHTETQLAMPPPPQTTTGVTSDLRQATDYAR